MPWTYSHPAAVLPFKRLCPRYMSWPALIAGSLSPDVAYHVDRFDIAAYAHTFAGSFVACLPLGMVLLLAFFAIRRPLWFMLPEPHRSALAPLVMRRPEVHMRSAVASIAGILLGAWTHSLWDLFTHGKTWITTRLTWLSETWLHIGETGVRGFTVLQDASSLGGATVLAAAYFSWLRRQSSTRAGNTSGDIARYCILLGAALLSIAMALFLAWNTAPAEPAAIRSRSIVVQAAIHGVSCFALLLAIASLSFHYLLGRRDSYASSASWQRTP